MDLNYSHFSKQLFIFLPLILLAILQIFNVEIIRWYFENYGKEKIIKSYSPNIRMPSGFEPLSVKEAPSDFEIVVVRDTKDGRYSETYYDRYGNERRVSFKNNQWKGTSTSCTAIQKHYWIPLIGFFLYILGSLMHSLRTGHWVCFSFNKIPPLIWREKVIFTYGLVLFTLGIFGNIPTCFRS